MTQKLFFFLFLFQALFAEMVYLKGTAPETFQEKEISLLTWNILGLPTLFTPIRSWKERVEEISNLIKDTDADVVVLQECYLKGLAMGIFKRIQHLYAHAYLDFRSKDNTLMSSGLAVFSKLPLGDFRFTPHPHRLDGEANFNMGTADFVLLDREKAPIAHIAASHFQGSSRCEWRRGAVSAQKKLDYAELRQEQMASTLNLSAPAGIPRYIAGDFNVDRASTEFQTSLLNSTVNPAIKDPLLPDKQLLPTSTSFFKHLQKIRILFPSLSAKEAASLGTVLKTLYAKELLQKPWKESLAHFTPTLFDQLEPKLDLSTEQKKKAWSYFKKSAQFAIALERKIWRKNENEGEVSISMGELLHTRALPLDEALDYILGINEEAEIYEIAILEGFKEEEAAKALSDHHPMLAKIRAARQDTSKSDSME